MFTLDIEPGSFISLIGPSGCGKSTLLRLIGGLDKPDAGEILLDNEKIMKPGSDRGFAFQGSNLFPWLTVKKYSIWIKSKEYLSGNERRSKGIY